MERYRAESGRGGASRRFLREDVQMEVRSRSREACGQPKPAPGGTLRLIAAKSMPAPTTPSARAKNELVRRKRRGGYLRGVAGCKGECAPQAESGLEAAAGHACARHANCAQSNVLARCDSFNPTCGGWRLRPDGPVLAPAVNCRAGELHVHVVNRAKLQQLHTVHSARRRKSGRSQGSCL